MGAVLGKMRPVRARVAAASVDDDRKVPDAAQFLAEDTAPGAADGVENPEIAGFLYGWGTVLAVLFGEHDLYRGEGEEVFFGEEVGVIFLVEEQLEERERSGVDEQGERSGEDEEGELLDEDEDDTWLEAAVESDSSADGSPVHPAAGSVQMPLVLLGKRSRLAALEDHDNDDKAELGEELPPVQMKRYRMAHDVPCFMSWKQAAVQHSMFILWRVSTLKAAVLNERVPGSKHACQQVSGKMASVKASKTERMFLHRRGNLFGNLSSQERALPKYFASSDKTSDGTPDSSAILANRRIEIQKFKGQGVQPVVNGLLFGVPIAALSGDVHLDEISWLLADSYTSVSFQLQRFQLYQRLPEMLFPRKRHEINSEIRAAIGTLRSMSKKIRAIVQELGGLPLIEPKAVWKESFPGIRGSS